MKILKISAMFEVPNSNVVEESIYPAIPEDTSVHLAGNFREGSEVLRSG